MSTDWGWGEAHLGATALTLEAKGERQAAALLLEATDVGYYTNEYLDPQHLAFIECPPLIAARFTEDVCETITRVLVQVASHDDIWVRAVSAVPGPADEGWREELERLLGLGPTNQARRPPTKSNSPTRDGLIFRDAGEVLVYEALKRAIEKRPSHESLLIAPNAGVWVGGRTREVDFLVTYQGRAGVIEVDGATHHGRRVADKSRERLLEDGGIFYVDRIAVEDTTSAEEVDIFVERFLGKLRP